MLSITNKDGSAADGVSQDGSRRKGGTTEHCPHMMAAIEKYGWNNIRHDIIAQGLTKEEAEESEIKYIALYKSNDRRYGYNIESGGSAPGRMSAQTREKIASRMRGDNNPTVRYGHPFKGKKHSQEAKEKMSRAASARIGRYVSDETKAKLREKQKKRAVIDTITGERYQGIQEAADATGTTATKVCAVCKGRRKSEHGHVWKYAEEVIT